MSQFPTNPLAIVFARRSTTVFWEYAKGDLGGLLKRRRREWEMSRIDLAQYLGVDYSSVRTWEEGLRFPYPAAIEQLSKWLNEDVPSPAISLKEVNGSRIFSERLRRHMTIRDVADRIGVAARTVRDWERGALNPGPTYRKLLRKWLLEGDADSLTIPHPLTKPFECDIGGVLKERRRELDMTQNELAKRLGVLRETIGRWENGEVPHMKYAVRIVEWLDEEIPTHKVTMDEISGDRIKNERLRRGMTERDLAGHLGVHVTAVNHWEMGARTPIPSNLRTLQEWFEEDVPSYMVRIEEIGDQIRNERLRRGITQQELADHLAVGVDTVHYWERGVRTPQPHFLSKLRGWFGESVPGHTVGIEGVGDRLRNERIRRGMTQRELADHLGVYKPVISKWERGLTTPRPHYLLKLREWFGGNVPSHSLRIDEFGDLAREERRRRGMTQQELADHLGVSKSRLSRWERGLSRIRPSNFKRLREWFEEGGLCAK